MEKVDTIICDVDGTIALRGDRSPYAHDDAIEDAPHRAVIELVDAACQITQAALILVTGRMEQHRAMTEYWLSTHHLFPQRMALFMRADGDHRADDLVKEEIYRTLIEPSYRVRYVFDDRNRVVAMWRRLGLLCIQVADGDF